MIEYPIGIQQRTMKQSSIWDDKELAVIRTEEVPMRILTIDNEEDIRILRSQCEDLSDEQLKSAEFQTLAQKMLASVDYPDSGGVGIAGPQIGLTRRIVALQRQDKKDKPFEVYANIRITNFRGEKKSGREGCLSVPGVRGFVERYRDIDIQYTDIETLEVKTERIKGFTAVIFQHECEHLDGILYIDKCTETFEP